MIRLTKQESKRTLAGRMLTALAGLSLVGLVACQGRGSGKAPDGADNLSVVELDSLGGRYTKGQIVGHWALEDVDQGVSYSVIFHPDQRMTQRFSSYDGRGKDRYGAWDLEGDTLVIDEQQGVSRLRIESLDDSTLVVDKGEEALPLYFRRLAE